MKQPFIHTSLLVILFFTSVVVLGALSEVKEPHFSNIKSLTLSGFGSGGSMAIQMGVAHSAKVSGVAAFSGLPYYCSRNNMTRLEQCFKHTETMSISDTMEILGNLRYYNLIDETENIAKQRVYLQSGKNDKSLTTAAALKSEELYTALGVPKGSLKTNIDIPSGHAMISVDYLDSEKNECGSATKKPYIQNCGFDLVGEAIKFITNDENMKLDGEKSLAQNLFQIDQRPFGSERNLMGDFGYIYIPSACQKDETQCQRLHVAFHGCDQLGDEFALNAGYNRVAELNNIVILYPRTRSQDRFNPTGCWDFFGTENGDDYRAELFLARLGPQLLTVAKTIESVGHFMDMQSLTERSSAMALGMAGAVVIIFVYQIYKLTLAPSKKKEE